MSIDLWHHYLLLRPLLVFVLAAPLLVLALIFRRRGRSRSSESKAHDDAAPMASSAMNESHPEQGPQRRVEAGPGEWRVGTVASDRRAA
jgi:hypothetical protein